MKRFFVTCVVVVAVSAAAMARAETWDVAKDFSITNGNPNGAWSYGYSVGFSQFTADTTEGMVANGGVCPDWGPSNQYGDIWKNTTSTTSFGVAPGQVSLSAGYAANAVDVVRWTAPRDMTVEVTGQFYSGDWGVMQTAIFVNGIGQSPYWSASDHGSFDFKLSVTSGETIDFAIYNGYTAGNTPLGATITAVPEPGTLVMLVAGIVGLAAYAWRKRKQ
jgi:hypothetical protein